MRPFGPFKLYAIEAGRFRLDGGAMFGIVPKPLWSRSIPSDETNRIPLAMRLLVIRDERTTPARVVVVDTGIGDKFADKQRQQFAIEAPEGGLLEALAAGGIDPATVTDVVLTHLHFDHSGGATTRQASGAFTATLPHATHHVQRRQWTWAQHPTERDQGSYRPDDYSALAAGGALHLLNGTTELLPGLSLIVSEGHTTGQQHVLLDGGSDGKLLYCADLIPTHAHVRLPWVMGYDLFPLTTLEEKKHLLRRGLDEDWTLFFEHDAELAACRLRDKDGMVVAGEPVSFG